MARGPRRPRDAGVRVREARRAPPTTTRRASSSSRSSTPSAGAGSRSSAVTRRSRWSSRGRTSSSTGAPPPGVPTGAGALAALEALLARVPGAARSTELPPFHGGVVGYLGYDVVREIERLPDVPPDDLGLPDAVLVGHRARHRVRPLPPAALPDRERVPRPGRRRRRGRRRRVRRRVRTARRAGRRAGAAAPVRAVATARGRPDRAPARTRRRCPSRVPRDAVEAAREHILAGDIFQVVLAAALRPRRPVRPVRRVPRAAPGEPVAVHVLRAPPRGDARGLVARADGAAARRAGDQPADRGHPPPGPHRGRRPAHGRRALGAPEGAGRARDARRPRPQRRRAGRAVRHRADGRADGARALLPRDAPHEPGRGRPRRRARTRSTCCGPRSPPAR